MKRLAILLAIFCFMQPCFAETRGSKYTPEQLYKKSTLVFRGTVTKIETVEKYNNTFPVSAAVSKILKGKLKDKEFSFKHKNPGKNVIYKAEFNVPTVGQEGTFYIQDQSGTLVLIGYIKKPKSKAVDPVDLLNHPYDLTVRDNARFEKQRKEQEAYFKKYGKYKKMKPFVPGKKVIIAPITPTTPTIPIDIAFLKKIAPKDIAIMRIYRLDWIEQEPVKRNLSKKFGTDSRQEIEGIISLIKKAPKMTSSSLQRFEVNPPDRFLVLRMVDGSAREIRYNSHLTQPFAGYQSRKLKEALCAISYNTNRMAIMKVKDDKSVDVTNMWFGSANPNGRTSNRIITIYLRLTAEGDLQLDLQVRDSSRKLLAKGKKIITYGGAAAFETREGEGKVIAYLLEPALKSFGI
ncbi:MAG: hypothetical protein FVQ82_12575 [Planctomycetes bacterium]|nr:hypothetical protein [Planctomycetota bacterium]